MCRMKVRPLDLAPLAPEERRGYDASIAALKASSYHGSMYPVAVMRLHLGYMTTKIPPKQKTHAEKFLRVRFDFSLMFGRFPLDRVP
jgi:hypothetical protein